MENNLTKNQLELKNSDLNLIKPESQSSPKTHITNKGNIFDRNVHNKTKDIGQSPQDSFTLDLPASVSAPATLAAFKRNR